MSEPVDNSERIAEINEILESGAQSISTDGVNVAINHESLRKERMRLIAADATLKKKKPRIVGVNLRDTF